MIVDLVLYHVQLHRKCVAYQGSTHQWKSQVDIQLDQLDHFVDLCCLVIRYNHNYCVVTQPLK